MNIQNRRTLRNILKWAVREKETTQFFIWIKPASRPCALSHLRTPVHISKACEINEVYISQNIQMFKDNICSLLLLSTHNTNTMITYRNLSSPYFTRHSFQHVGNLYIPDTNPPKSYIYIHTKHCSLTSTWVIKYYSLTSTWLTFLQLLHLLPHPAQFPQCGVWICCGVCVWPSVRWCQLILHDEDQHGQTEMKEIIGYSFSLGRVYGGSKINGKSLYYSNNHISF